MVMMRAARLVLFTSIALLVVVWGAMLTSMTWAPAGDLGVGLLVVGGFAAGHAVVLALATTAAILAAIALPGTAAARTSSDVATLAAAAALAVVVAAYLGFLM